MKKKKLYVFISVYVHVMYCIMCVQFVWLCGTVCMWRCVNECVCVLLDQEQDTANFIWTAKGSLLPNESQGMFLVSFSVLLVCFVTLNVVWCIWKWHYSAPTLLCFLLLGGVGGVSIKPFGNFLPVAYTDKHTFVLCSPAVEESKEHQSQ